MRLDGELTVQAGRDAVFEAVRDARFFASCLEGVSEFTEIDPAHFAAVMETRLSFMKFRFKLAIEVLRVEPPCEIEARITGSPIGLPGRLTALSVTTLSETAAGTRLEYVIDVALTGKLGSLGQTAFSAKAQEMTKQFGDNLRAALEPGALANAS